MSPVTIPTVKPLKKSFVIVALVFLLIGFGIEFGGPVPNFQEMAAKAKEEFEKSYWEDVKDEVERAVKTGKQFPLFTITIEEKKENFEIFGFTIEPSDEEGDSESGPIVVEINFSSSEQKMIEEAKDKVLTAKWERIQGGIGKAKNEGKLDAKGEKPPGFSLESDGLFIWIIFFSILISLVGMTVSKASIQRAGMIASIINAVIVILVSIVVIVKAILKLTIIFILLFSFFAFLYPIIFEFPFPTGRVVSLAGTGLTCKIVAAILIWIGGSHIIRIKSFTLFVLCGFLTSIIITIVLPIAKYLLAASIADAVIGIIIAIIVIIWSIYILIGAIRGLVSTAI
ncbi:MAG: hypothetical protein ACMUIL_03295 [bacterium]